MQVYAAADNACLSTVVHQGRVNQAVFIRLNLEYKCSSSEILELKDGESGERGNDIFVAAVTDSRMLHLYDGSGRQVSNAVTVIYLALSEYQLVDLYEYI